MKKTIAGAVAAALALSSGPAFAATATGQFNVKMTITASCTVGTAADLDFGTAGSIASNVDATTNLQVTCTNGATYNVGLSNGGNFSGGTRRMISGSNFINYELYRDSGRSQPFGNTVGTDTVAGTGNGAAQSIPVYGRVPAQPGVAVGDYTDVVTITVTY